MSYTTLNYNKHLLCVGVPSGHVMISTAVLLTCTCYLTPTTADHKREKKAPSRSRLAPSVSYNFAMRMMVVAFATVIGLTRVLISSHFVHQVCNEH